MATKAEKLKAIGDYLTEENIDFFYRVATGKYKREKVNKLIADQRGKLTLAFTLKAM